MPTDDSSVPPSDSAADQAPADTVDRLTEPVDRSPPPRLPFPVVGIGASAGGLEAFTELFKHMPSDTGMAFVLIQHLPPERDSLMVEIMARRTAMPVLQVADGMAVQPNHVYIIRPGRTLTIRDGHLHLGEPVEKPLHRRPVDDFFRSLAEEQREQAIAIIMSGMDSNGTAGSQAVKALGGMTIAQDPESAQFPAMPRNMIQAGVADFILTPAEMPGVIQRYAQHPYIVGTESPESIAQRDRQSLNEIMAVLRTRTRHDFSAYKRGTIVRRVQRRMGLSQVHEMREYVRVLRQSQSEVTELADDLMIHVTGFFRDGDGVWETLKREVIVPLVDLRENNGEIRAWVAACSTGEEAYTLAILILEAAEARGKQFDVKIFATDTADRSLNHARGGIYAGGIEDEIPPSRLDRFFDKEDGVYRIKKELRQMVLFASQNILQDPPFSRLDICTCRNMLIYLEPAAQKQAIALLHFALVSGGALLLGNSEAVIGQEQLFEPIDKKIRLFRRIGPTRGNSVDFPRLKRDRRTTDTPGADSSGVADVNISQRANRMLLERYTPPSVVINRQEEIVFFHGDTTPYLDQPRGDPTRDLLSLTREFCRGAVRTALAKALNHDIAAVALDGSLETPGGRMRLEVIVTPLDPPPSPSPRHFLVSFHPVRDPVLPPAVAPDGSSIGNEARALQDELQRMRDELQSAIEELQASTEEMKASNEEAMSINEELQSTNEELETSKEELQSLNEELSTVNSQLQAKMEELEHTGNDLSSLLSSTDIAVLFLDTQFRIRRYTPAVKDLLQMIPSDVGRPLRDLNRKFEDDSLLADAAVVLERLVPIEKEIPSVSGHTYMRKILPYRRGDHRIGGVVITFVDISARKEAENALRANEARVAEELTAVNALFQLTARLLVCTDLKSAMKEVLDAAITIHGADMGDIQLIDAETKTLKLAASRGLSSSFVQEFKETQGDSSTSSGQAMQSGERVVIEDIELDRASEPHRLAAAETGYRAVQSTPLLTRNGELVGMLSTHFRRPHRPSERDLQMTDLYARQAADVIERLRADEVIRRNEERLRRVIAIETVGVMFHKLSGEIYDANDAFLEQVGYTRQEMEQGQLRLETITPEDWVPRTMQALGELESTGRHPAYEKQYLHRDGTRWWGLVAGTRLEGSNVVQYITDVTQRRQAQDLLRENEGRLRRVLEIDTVGIMFLDAEGRISDCNAAFLSFTGLSREQIDSKSVPWRQITPIEWQPLAEAAIDTVRRDGHVKPYEKQVFRTDGSRRWGLFAALRLDDKSVVEYVVDITERKLAEAARSQSDSYLRSITDIVPDLLWRSESSGENVWVNQRWMDYTGRSREEAKGQGWLKTIHPDEQEQVKASLRRGIQDGTSVRAEHRIRAADGSYRWFLINSLPARDDSGKILHWVGAATDIHEEQQARASLEGAKQIAESANLAKDRFLAAVSHELRTPLAAILLWTKLLQESKPAEDAETHQGLTAIRSSAEAQKNLIEDLLDSSRIAEGKMRLDLKPTDLPSTVRSAVDAILPAAHAKGVTVVSDIGDVGTVMADPHRLQQVVWNLLTNGVKFTPPGGTITLVLSRQEDDVEIRVTDTGVGIDPAFLPRIFDRFQQGAGTPSQAASGLGLGLAISRQLVELHQGSISATSRGPDLGSTFTVSLPLPLIDEGGESAAP